MKQCKKCGCEKFAAHRVLYSNIIVNGNNHNNNENIPVSITEAMEPNSPYVCCVYGEEYEALTSLPDRTDKFVGCIHYFGSQKYFETKKEDMKKEDFKEFSKIVLYLCNHSKRKVYIQHLKIMLVYYLIKNNNSKNKLFQFEITSQDIEIACFDEFLNIMQKIGFIELDENFYGTIVIAKKKLQKTLYNNSDLQILDKIVGKNFEELQNNIGINK